LNVQYDWDNGKAAFSRRKHGVDFLDAIATGREPRVNGEEALRVHRLIDALLASARNGAPVHCNPPA